ncbi:MAG: N-6 DNA methylase, partial [Planctomycetia bacterium]|nr:N-6 DNA methylase [Planctomycetia bacterium]
LSLLLKVLEGESKETLNQQRKLFHERALPDLGNNIKCGNSLIGPDFYDNQQINLLDDEERYRINVFDWEAEFPQIFDEGRFDAVIGNPPYGAMFSNREKIYIKKTFKSYNKRYDSYVYFMEVGHNLINCTGCLSYITPELWLTLEIGHNIRKILYLDKCLFEVLIHGENVFSNATVNTCTFVASKRKKNKHIKIKGNHNEWLMSYEQWQESEQLKIDYRLNSNTKVIIDKILDLSISLSQCGKVIQGITPYDKYRGQSEKIIKSRAYHFDYKKDDTCGKWLAGKDVTRYHNTWSGEWLSYGDWLAAKRLSLFFKGSRLLFREIPGRNKRIQATYIEKEKYYHGHSITPFIATDRKYSLFYLLGVVNSKLASWIGNLLLGNFGKNIFPKLNPKDIIELPIRKIDFANKDEKTQHDKMVNLVDRMLELNKQLPKVKTDHDRTTLQRQIDATDKQIDKLVYKLYNLTEEEIKIVEER